MATETEKLKLNMPDENDAYDVSIFHNESMQKIDDFANQTDTRVTQVETGYVKSNHVGNVKITSLNSSYHFEITDEGLTISAGNETTGRIVKLTKDRVSFSKPVTVDGKDILTEINNRYTKTQANDLFALKENTYTKTESDTEFLSKTKVSDMRSGARIRMYNTSNPLFQTELVHKAYVDSKVSTEITTTSYTKKQVDDKLTDTKTELRTEINTGDTSIRNTAQMKKITQNDGSSYVVDTTISNLALTRGVGLIAFRLNENGAADAPAASSGYGFLQVVSVFGNEFSGYAIITIRGTTYYQETNGTGTGSGLLTRSGWQRITTTYGGLSAPQNNIGKDGDVYIQYI